ncbi:hypothetical protein FDP41_011064 [Naegleria fowleri]|uniref:HECT-type E3 ubiquitin transferase n=1 Tax=Naegleria fowleri TaxID=5763 RepID=A0A6A5C5P8_NAEFO|nr:uncharacterized protein FDP41_011064 [Naegleria fowleri]KAF0983086.1 hypothetical protein FDP41_011064 [Naegleria fowleri]
MGQSPSGREDAGDDIQNFWQTDPTSTELSSPELKQKKNFLLKLFKIHPDQLFNGHVNTPLSPTTTATLKTFTSHLDSNHLNMAQSASMLASRSAFSNIIGNYTVDEEEDLTSVGSFVRKEKASEPLVMRNVKDFKRFKHFNRITCLKVNRDRVWTASLDKTICCWDRETGDCIKLFQGHSKAVTCFHIDIKNGLLYSGSYDRSVKVWDIETQNCVQTFDSNENWISCLAVGNGYLFCSGYDYAISVYDVKTGKKIAKMVGHFKKVEDMIFNHSEGILYTTGADCTVRAWDVSSLTCVKVHLCREYCHYFTKYGNCIYVSQPQNIYSFNIETNKSNPLLVGITNFCVLTEDNPEDGSYLAGWNKEKRQFEIYDLNELTLLHTLPQDSILDASNLYGDLSCNRLYFTSGCFVKFIDISVIHNAKNSTSLLNKPVYMHYEELFNYFVEVLFYPVTKVADAIEQLDSIQPLSEFKNLNDQIERLSAYFKQQQVEKTSNESSASLTSLQHSFQHNTSHHSLMQQDDLYYISKGIAQSYDSSGSMITPNNYDKATISDREFPNTTLQRNNNSSIYFELSVVPQNVMSIAERMKAIASLCLDGFNNNTQTTNNVTIPSVIYTDSERELDYETRKELFYHKLRQLKGEGLLQPTVVFVRREHLVFDACKNFSILKGVDLMKPMFVYFAGEQGFDVGGVTREFYHLLSQKILDSNNALFVRTGHANTYHPNPTSAVNADHLQYFHFIGKLIGKALSDNKMMDTHFSKVIFKLIVGRPVTFEDLEAVEPTMYLSLKKMLLLDNIDSIMEMTFTADINDFGENNVYELCENGEEIEVNDDNKYEFVEAYAKWKLVESVRPQVEKMLEGIYEVIPPEYLTIFNESELELLLCGSTEFSISEWRQHTFYEGGFDDNHPTVQLFWKMLEQEFSHLQQAQLLQFATGTSCLPCEGFSGLSPPFTLCLLRHYISTEYFPVAHTCLNRIDIPPYETLEKMTDRFKKALRLGGSQGFSMH